MKRWSDDLCSHTETICDHSEIASTSLREWSTIKSIQAKRIFRPQAFHLPHGRPRDGPALSLQLGGLQYIKTLDSSPSGVVLHTSLQVQPPSRTAASSQNEFHAPFPHLSKPLGVPENVVRATSSDSTTMLALQRSSSISICRIGCCFLVKLVPRVTSSTSLHPVITRNQGMALQTRRSFNQFGRGLDNFFLRLRSTVVAFNPVKNYNFGWGTIFFYSNNLQWVNCLTSQSGRLHVVRMELLCKMPHQNVRLDRVFSDSAQHCLV